MAGTASYRRRSGQDRRRQACVLLSAAAVVVATACAEKAPAAPPAPLEIKSQGGWTAASAQPVLKAGDLRPQGLWNDPSVLSDDAGGYVMYMTTSVGQPFAPPILPFRAVSADGKSWTLSPSTPLVQATGTAFAAIETPSVVRFQGRWHMFFTGVYAKPNPAPMAIGHAVSDDGISWKASPRPVIAATGRAPDWNGYLVGEPGAVVVGDEMLVYFSAVGARPGGRPPQLQTIGLARTTDGERFSAPVQVLGQSALYPASEGYVGYSTPAAVVLKGRVHLFYDVAQFEEGGDPEWRQVALHHAVSPDGQTGFVQDAAPIFTRDDFAWTSGEIMGPAPLVVGDQMKLWFGGHVRRPDLAPLIRRGLSGPEFGIGHASKSLAAFE